MTSQENVLWNVVILADEHNCSKTYEFSPNTSLDEIMDTWMDDCQPIGCWVFLSGDRRIQYYEFMTLEMIGETGLHTGIVTLRVKLLYDDPDSRPTTEIYGNINEECRLIQVEPEEQLFEVRQRLLGRGTQLEYNGEALDLDETIDEAGMRNYDVISECQRQISLTVKLSTGLTRIFFVADDSFVLHLFEKVTEYETEDFSLLHQGRYLHMHDRVKDIKQVVEVTRAHFVVNIDDQRVSWITRNQPMTFDCFLTQLSIHGELNVDKLKRVEFSCVGCHRIISKSEDAQLLPIQCCKERSLTLIAKPQSNTKTALHLEAINDHIQQLKDHLDNFKVNDSERGVIRFKCEKIKRELFRGVCEYNLIIRMCEEVRKSITDLEDQIKMLESDHKSLKVENEILTREIRRLKSVAIAVPGEGHQMKLMVFYHPGRFVPVISRSEIQLVGKYPYTDPVSHIKCVIAGLQAGWVSFETLRDVLQPLFNSPIMSFYQRLGVVDGKDVAVIASSIDDEVPGYQNQQEYSDEDAGLLTWEEAGKPVEFQRIVEGGRVLLCGGQRRTALSIRAY